MMAIVLFVYGLAVGGRLPIDVFPDLDRPVVAVLTEGHGLGAEEIETQVTTPLELALGGAPGVERVRSVSKQGLSLIWVEFGWSADIFNARQVVSERIQESLALLPPDTIPVLGPISSIMGEILLVGLRAPGADPTELRRVADTLIRPRLLAIPGISVVAVVGGERERFTVAVDLPTLHRYDLTVGEVAAAIRRANVPSEGGVIPAGPREILVRTTNSLKDIAALGDIPVPVGAAAGGVVVSLREIARIERGGDVSRRGDAGVNGEPAVVLSIQKQPQADTLTVTAAVDRELTALRTVVPPGFSIDSDLFRQSDFIARSVDNIIHAIVVGAILITVVLVVFLGNLRTTIITLTTIPLSLAVTVGVFHLLGLSIDTMTLGGIAIAVGELVDDAIVDVENVFRRLRENRDLPSPRSTVEVVFAASSEIRNSIVIATIIVIAVFVPLFFLGGIEGRIFAPLGVAYITAILASLIVAVTVTPVLCSLFLSNSAALGAPHEGRFVRWLKGLQIRLLAAGERALVPVLSAVGVVFLGAIVVAARGGREFLPPFNEGSLTINAVLPSDASLAESSRIGAALERAILTVPEVRSVGRRTGRAELDEHAQGVNSSEFEVNMLPSERSRGEVIAAVRRVVERFPGVQVDVGQPISHRIDHLLSGVEAQIVVKVFGPDLDTLREIGAEVRNVGRTVGGIVDLRMEPQVLAPQAHVRIELAGLVATGLDRSAILGALDEAIGGRAATEIVDGNRRIDVTVVIPEVYASYGDALTAVPIRTPQGHLVPLGSVLAVTEGKGPNLVSRESGSRRLGVYANVAERDLVGVVEEWRGRVMREVTLPPGYVVRFEGQFESQAGASRLLQVLGLLALGIIGLVLFSHYRRLGIVAQIMLSVPYAAIGALVAVYLTGNVFSVASLVGLITVTGIAVRNGVMMIDHILHLAEVEGAPRTLETVYRAAQERLVPVSMTALTALLALVPILAAPGEPGRELLAPVAVVIFGGLCTGTLLNLALTPLVFWRWSGWGPLHNVER
jgi:CzcA family heavy metal efflux pump